MIYDFRLESPEDSSVKIVSIDPGSNNCGFAVLTLDLNNRKISIDVAHTLKGNDAKKNIKMHEPRFGNRETRNLGYGLHLESLIKPNDPVCVVCEAPYAQFIATYKALVEQNTVFRCVVWNWDRRTPFQLLEASKVKANMGVNGNSGDKLLMKEALALRKDVTYASELNIETFDEHTVDAICVGLLAADHILEGVAA